MSTLSPTRISAADAKILRILESHESRITAVESAQATLMARLDGLIAKQSASPAPVIPVIAPVKPSAPAKGKAAKTAKKSAAPASLPAPSSTPARKAATSGDYYVAENGDLFITIVRGDAKPPVEPTALANMHYAMQAQFGVKYGFATESGAEVMFHNAPRLRIRGERIAIRIGRPNSPAAALHMATVALSYLK